MVAAAAVEQGVRRDTVMRGDDIGREPPAGLPDEALWRRSRHDRYADGRRRALPRPRRLRRLASRRRRSRARRRMAWPAIRSRPATLPRRASLRPWPRRPGGGRRIVRGARLVAGRRRRPQPGKIIPFAPRASRQTKALRHGPLGQPGCRDGGRGLARLRAGHGHLALVRANPAGRRRRLPVRIARSRRPASCAT